MNFSNPIYWQQGIFLQPQHFQYSDQFHATSYARLFGLARIQPYGVANLVISKERLSAGFLSCTAFQAVIPEGLWIDIKENARLPDRDIRNLIKENGRYRVAFGLPNITAGLPAVVTVINDGRFETPGYPEVLPDLYNDSPDLAIDRLWLRGRFLIGNEIEAAKNMSILTMGYLLVENSTVTLDPHYSPPCLQVGAYVVLKTQVHDLIEVLSTRLTSLKKLSTPWRFSSHSLDPVWLRDRMVQADLSQAVTELNHRVSRNVEPAHLFEVLSVLAGRLCSTGGLSFPEMPHWEIEDPANSFKRIREIVEALLVQLKSGPDSSAIFYPQGGWYEAKVPNEVRVGKYLCYLILHNLSEAELMQVGPPKLAPLSRIETIVSRALPGVALERLHRIPYGLGEGSNAFVWEVDTKDALWIEANATGKLCLNWLDLPQHARASVVYFRA